MKKNKTAAVKNKGIALLFAAALAAAGFSCSKYDSTLKVYNFGDYIDPELISEFEKEYRIKIVYSEFDIPENMYAKVSSSAESYDVAFSSDYMIERMIRLNMLHKLDYGKIPNAAYIGERFSGLSFDPQSEYSVPYMWGTVGILYDTTKVSEPVQSWDILWNPAYRKNILMQDSIRDAMAVALRRLGYSLNSTNPDELSKARDALIEQKPLVLAYVLDEAKDKMIAGEAAISVVYSGDAAYAMKENDALDYVIPEEGSNIWLDCAIIPAGAQNLDGAYAFINFLCDPEIALRNADYIGYASPIPEVERQAPDEIRLSSAYYPPEDALRNCEFFHDREPNVLSIYESMWLQVKASSGQ